MKEKEPGHVAIVTAAEVVLEGPTLGGNAGYRPTTLVMVWPAVELDEFRRLVWG